MKCEKCNSEMEFKGYKFLDEKLVECDWIWKCKCCLHIQFIPKIRTKKPTS
jgi:hypothetical protein